MGLVNQYQGTVAGVTVVDTDCLLTDYVVYSSVAGSSVFKDDKEVLLNVFYASGDSINLHFETPIEAEGSLVMKTADAQSRNTAVFK